MAILATGDTHGHIERRFGTRNFPEQRELRENGEENIVIVLGDFGLIWDPKQSKQERYLARWLDEKPWTTLFVDGNHENHDRLNSGEFETVELFGGRAHKVTDSIYHLIRGEVYEIDGKTFFCFGGAKSHDLENLLDPVNDPGWKQKRKRLRKQYENFRVIGQSWWEDELPSDDDRENAVKNLDRVGWHVDYVLSHAPAASTLAAYNDILKKRGKKPDWDDPEPDPASGFLEELKERGLEYGQWLCGHLHANAQVADKDRIVYTDIVELD